LKTDRRQLSSRPAPARLPCRSHSNVAKAGELAELRARLADAEETLRAIRRGEVDAVVVAGKHGSQVFTLDGAEHAYRVLIESMNEGALTLTAKGVILYANQCFARMAASPLQQVIGSSVHRFLSEADRDALRPVLKRAGKSSATIQVLLHAGDGSQMPAHISIRPLPKNSIESATIGMVVTDMTQARRNEELLRTLAHGVVQTQEAERGRVANELRVNITQLLYVILGRCQALAEKLQAGDSSACVDTRKINEMVSRTAEEVERIWRSLWSHELDKLGLIPALEKANAGFVERTGVALQIDCSALDERLPAEAELALYRIHQEALNNVERHARARNVTVRLTKPDGCIQLTIKDDGIGFDPDHPANGKERQGLGLLRMRERAASVGGALSVKSAPRTGMEIEVRIPLPLKPPQ
jgi:two-component system, NarL family, sensor kinase